MRLFIFRSSSLNINIRKVIPVVTAVIALIAAQSISTPANAASKGYRYWSYYHSDQKTLSWVASQTGAAVDVAGGEVEGWSFVFDGDAVPSNPPSIKPDFTKICGSKKAPNGKKKVGLVIDFGKKAYAPLGEKVPLTITRCVITSTKSQGIDILAQAVKVRSDSSGFVCGLKGYPVKECGVEIETPAALLTK